MDIRAIRTLAGRLLRQPTAPYHEHAVRSEVERICGEHGLESRRDQFGNVLVRLQTGGQRRAMVLAAHMDHPGFEVMRGISAKSWLVRFRGGVPDDHFRPGLRIRLMPGNVPARLGRRVGTERTFVASAAAGAKVEAAPEFAMWDLEPFAVRSGRIYSRACDDVVGVACILATLVELKKRRSRVNVIGVISRAEEVGFHGALAVAARRSLPSNALVVSLETSRELPGARIGEGVILRVGDRTSVFDSDGMRYLGEIAGELKEKRAGFEYQRALMSGGTCEATAYQEYGYQTTAVCVALGNYHNCAPRKKIAEEYVSLSDTLNMVDLLVAAARRMEEFPKLVGKLPMRLRAMGREAQEALAATALG